MKPNLYTNAVLTVIALLLLVLITRSSIPSAHAAATPKYSYGWYRSGGISDDAMDQTMKELADQSVKEGCNLISAVPLTNGTGRVGAVLYICQQQQ